MKPDSSAHRRHGTVPVAPAGSSAGLKLELVSYMGGKKHFGSSVGGFQNRKTVVKVRNI